MKEIKQFYSVSDFAKELGLHPVTIRRAIRSKRINALRVSDSLKGRYRIPGSEILRLCDKNYEFMQKAIQNLQKE